MYVFTSKIGRYKATGALDITVKGQDPVGKIFAPTWDMVMGVKNGTMTQETYIHQYLQILANIPLSYPDQLAKITTSSKIVLLCYCAQYNFCHRNLASAWLVDRGATFGGYIE